MKKKKKPIIKKKPHISTRIQTKKKIHPTVRKVIMVGEDEFCPTCMEWRKYDELTGKCMVCGCLIKKISDKRKITDEYDLKDFTNGHDEPQETEEF